MGHAVDYITVAKRSDISKAADNFAARNVDRQENPSGSYHGNLTIHDRPICDNYNEAVRMIEQWDTGFYSDHAVQYKDKGQLEPTKAMKALKERAVKLKADKLEYEEKHSVKHRKSEFVGCKECGSKVSIKHLKSERCPVCGKDLRADYIIERLRKFDTDIKEGARKYDEMEKKQAGKCPILWLVKVEVHC